MVVCFGYMSINIWGSIRFLKSWLGVVVTISVCSQRTKILPDSSVFLHVCYKTLMWVLGTLSLHCHSAGLLFTWGMQQKETAKDKLHTMSFQAFCETYHENAGNLDHISPEVWNLTKCSWYFPFQIKSDDTEWPSSWPHTFFI